VGVGKSPMTNFIGIVSGLQCLLLPCNNEHFIGKSHSRRRCNFQSRDVHNSILFQVSDAFFFRVIMNILLVKVILDDVVIFKAVMSIIQ